MSMSIGLFTVLGAAALSGVLSLAGVNGAMNFVVTITLTTMIIISTGE